MSAVILVKAPADPGLERVREVARHCPVVEVDELSTGACRRAGVAPEDVGAVLGATPQADDLAFLPSLEWVHSRTAGVDSWLDTGALPPTVRLTSAAGNGAIPLAEHALMLMLMLSRNAPRWLAAQARAEWDRYTHGELTGATLGIVGYGNSGKDLARKAQACHMNVQALRRTDAGPADGDVLLRYGTDGLAALLRTSDYVVVTAPLTAQTRNLIGAQELRAMRTGAFLVVVSRGGIVNEQALVEALRSGELAGAGLDAHEHEPLPADSPLWTLPNAIITPHNGATTPLTGERGRQILLDNVARWVSGEPLRNVVDVEHGY